MHILMYMYVNIYLCTYVFHATLFVQLCLVFCSAFAGSSLCYANEHFDQLLFLERGLQREGKKEREREGLTTYCGGF